LFGRQDERGRSREAWFADEAALAERESHNLLYVALTRAKQALIISGDAEKNAWLDRVDAAWRDLALPTALPLAAAGAPTPRPAAAPIVAPAVGHRAVRSEAGPEAARGELFHACLERHAPPGTARDLDAIAARLGLDAERAGIEAAARALLALPQFAHLFDPARYRRAHNELALLDAEGRAQRLDRVVELDDAVWLIDYKTGDDDAAQSDARLIERHTPQLARYRELLAALFPDKPVHTALLLASGRLVALPASLPPIQEYVLD
jgi:ATP-dependent helicase/nuclease subunit A